jgi:hypothetical protein
MEVFIAINEEVSSTNNLNDKLIAYGSKKILKQLGIMTCGYAFIDAQYLIFLIERKDDPSDSILVSFALYKKVGK